MLKIENLKKVFRTEEVETVALNDVSLEVDEGEFIAIMGPSGCGKSTFFIRQRTKEIAVRKVHGADNFEILSKLVRIFLGYVLIAFVIAVPVIWYIMRQWLDDYSYRIGLSPLIFIAAGAFCFMIAFISVYWQSRVAANANPVKAIKSE